MEIKDSNITNSTECFITDPSMAKGSGGVAFAIYKYFELLRKEEKDHPAPADNPNIFLPYVEQILKGALKSNIEASYQNYKNHRSRYASSFLNSDSVGIYTL
jgi:hypothetical protein